MKHPLFVRLLSLFLAFALMVPCFPQVTAEELIEEIAGQTEAVEETEASEAAETTEASEEADVTEPSEETEVTEPSEETEATEPSEETEVTEPSEETEATESSEETEATEPSEETEATEPEETEPTEETEPEELPYGFHGMPEGYEQHERSLEKRDAMQKQAVLEAMSQLTAGRDYVPNQITVSAATEEEALLIAQAYCGELTHFANELALITLQDATVLEAMEASLNEELNLPTASPNYTFRLNPMPSSITNAAFAAVPTEMDWSAWVQDTLTNPDPALLYPYEYDYQYAHDVVDSYAAWGVTLGDSDIQVAVVDSGVDIDHADLQNIATYNVGCGTDDIVGHGTHVCGIIASTLNNGLGGSGIAPNVSVTSYRCADNYGSVSSYYMYQGIYTATSRGADIISLSIGGYWPDAASWDDCDIEYAIRRANSYGVTVIAAMGNDGSNTMCYPAAYNGVIAVAATDRSNRRAWYSNFGAWCDVAAPGSDIYSTYPRELDTNDGLQDGYTRLDGTSMATPVVTAVCALYMSWFGHVSPTQMEKILESSAVKCSDSGMGAGIVNIANMLDGKPSAPTFRLYNNNAILFDYEEYDGSVVPCETQLSFATYGDDQSRFVLYTTDGKTPGVKNGQIVNGTEVNGRIDLSPFAGSTVTIKAVQVSGMGIPGKVLTKKIKVADSTQITGITISGPDVIVSGRTGQFTATVNPADKANQSVVWSIVSPNRADVKISKAGVLTTPKNYSGTITIRATSAVNSSYSATKPVSVRIINPVAKMALNYSKFTMFNDTTLPLYVATMVDASGYPIDPDYSGVEWVSSNKKVATVDQDGNVIAVGKGKAVITCKALDGSKKSAKCTITVMQQVTGIAITGNTAIHPGGATVLKATVYPSNANNKRVFWTLDSAPAGVTISTTGSLKVPSYISSGTITVRATPCDGFDSNTYATYTLKIQPKITSLYLDERTTYEGWAGGPTYNSKGSITKFELFSVDLNETSAQDNYCELAAYTTGGSVGVTWTSSNPAVASISENGKITAHKAGTAKITVKAMDCSKKSASVTIKVTNPVSYMEIKTNAPQMSNYTPYIGIGKSVTNKIVFGDTYGVPGNKKVEWDFAVYEVDYMGNAVYNWTNFMKTNKMVTVSNGKVTVKKTASAVWNNVGSTDGYYNELMLELYCYSTDGSYTMATKNFLLIPPTTDMFMYSNYKSVSCYRNGQGVAYFRSNQWHLFENFYECGFIATSSNPKVASVVGIYTDEYGDGYDYACYFATGQKGTAKITLKATDGSNKSCSFTVRVP